MYFMQWPSMIDRLLATMFHQSYEHWSWYGTVGRVIVVWLFVVFLALNLITISNVVTIVGFATSIIIYTIIYGSMFYINIKRYKTSQKSPNLRERYQLAENMRSLYPLFWISIIEIFMNASTAIFVVVFYICTHNTIADMSYNVGDPLISVFREVVMIVYCLPFLVYSEKRRHRKFMNKINVQSQQEHDLYFRSLKNQWGIT
uniref:DUF3278 domain-containing protein n=1 Tax=Panagrellus redivivus TaxID=6233 RepID=A0A7E4VU16_PANRE